MCASFFAPPPPRPAAPGAFDFARFAYFQGLGAVGFALGDARRIAPSGQDGPPNESIDAPSGSMERLRYAIAERIRAALTGERGAVAVALITGFREGIPESVEQNMRDSGLAHLLAISGLHVGLVAGTVFLLVRGGCALVPAIALRWPIKKWAAVSAAAVAFGYLFLAGATEPTQRAFLMLLITVIGICLDRGSISMRLVAWAALFILLLSPESLLSVSFQLSFAAVTALVAVYETITARREWAANEPARVQSAGSRFPRYALQLGLSSMIATLATAPFALYHFNRVAGYGLLANLAAVPLTAFVIMPLGLLAVFLMPLGLEAGPLYLMGQGIGAVLWVARQVASLPGAATLVPAFPHWGLVAVTLGGLWLCIWRGPWRWLGLAGFAAAAVASLRRRHPTSSSRKTGASSQCAGPMSV